MDKKSTSRGTIWEKLNSSVFYYKGYSRIVIYTVYMVNMNMYVEDIKQLKTLLQIVYGFIREIQMSFKFQ